MMDMGEQGKQLTSNWIQSSYRCWLLYSATRSLKCIANILCCSRPPPTSTTRRFPLWLFIIFIPPYASSAPSSDARVHARTVEWRHPSVHAHWLLWVERRCFEQEIVYNTSTHNAIVTIPAAIKQEFPAFFSSFEAFSEYDDESKMLKRRGPRTTIKQNQVSFEQSYIEQKLHCPKLHIGKRFLFQLDVLNRIFSTTPKPSKHARAKLALETGLSMRVIQVNKLR